MSTLALKPSLFNKINLKHINPYLKNPFDSKKCHVEVEFNDNLSNEQVISSIGQLPNPQVIVWYIGCYGLRDTGVRFYKDFLISPIFKQHTEATFWLVDLTAWGAFKNPQCSIHNFSSFCGNIEGFSDKKIKSIKSSAIFKKMQELSEKELIDHFKKALQRKFISTKSKDFPNNNIRIKEILSNNSPIIADWHDHDANKCYSVFQYLEGCLLVDEIFMQEIVNKEVADIQIVFALPNDELNYYRDNENSFQKDVAYLISNRCKSLNIKNINLQIKFLSFKYGSHSHDRPYNAPGKRLKNGILSYKDIVGHEKSTPVKRS